MTDCEFCRSLGRVRCPNRVTEERAERDAVSRARAAYFAEVFKCRPEDIAW